jgi:flagellum-specific ATP synthase
MNLARLCETVDAFDVFQTLGRVRSSRGVLLACTLPAAVGDRCQVSSAHGQAFLGEVIGFANDLTYVVLYEHAEVHPGMTVERLGKGASLLVGDGLLGRILDGLGRPIDNLGPLTGCTPRRIRAQVPPPLDRDRIR